MPLFINHFGGHDERDFDVLVRLEDSQRQSSIIALGDKKERSDIETAAGEINRNNISKPVTGYNFNPQTIDGLRAEIDHGMQNTFGC